MMTLAFTTLDVFTKTPFQGNPLAVVTIPPGATLTQAQKQAIAREFNYSETVFVHDVNSSDETGERRFDIFTTTAELPFAGHPTIGTATFLHSRGIKTLIAKAGPITIEPAADGALRAAIPHNVHLHQQRPSSIDPSAFPASLVDVAKAELQSRLFSIVRGMTFVLIQAPSLDVLGAAKIASMPELGADLLDEGWRDGWVTRRYYYVRLGSRQIRGRTVHSVRTRLIKLNMEDPGTGSAACALAAYLSLYVFEERSITFEITQGVEMGRESNILVDVEVGMSLDGERKLEALHLGGSAVPVMTGSLTPPSMTPWSYHTHSRLHIYPRSMQSLLKISN